MSALDPESRSPPCPASVMCAGVVFPWSSRSVPTQEQSPQLPWSASEIKDGYPPSVMRSSLGVSTLPYPSPVLGMATAVWNLSTPAPYGLATWCTREVARGVYDYEMTAKLCQLLSAGGVAQEAGLIGIDRWMLRRSYCVCVWRLTSVCGRVSSAERLMWSIVGTAPCQSDMLKLKYLLFSPAPCRRGWTLT